MPSRKPRSVRKPAGQLPLPQEFATYQQFLRSIRIAKGLKAIEVSERSAHPDYPHARAKEAAISRMEGGAAPNPTFRQMVLYSRGYGVSLIDLAYFFQGAKPESETN